MARAECFSAQIRPAALCSSTPAQAASIAEAPLHKKPVMQPARTSPLPALANPLLGAETINVFAPSVMTVKSFFNTITAFVRAASSWAASTLFLRFGGAERVCVQNERELERQQLARGSPRAFAAPRAHAESKAGKAACFVIGARHYGPRTRAVKGFVFFVCHQADATRAAFQCAQRAEHRCALHAARPSENACKAESALVFVFTARRQKSGQIRFMQQEGSIGRQRQMKADIADGQPA